MVDACPSSDRHVPGSFCDCGFTGAPVRRLTAGYRQWQTATEDMRIAPPLLDELMHKLATRATAGEISRILGVPDGEA